MKKKLKSVEIQEQIDSLERKKFKEEYGMSEFQVKKLGKYILTKRITSSFDPMAGGEYLDKPMAERLRTIEWEHGNKISRLERQLDKTRNVACWAIVFALATMITFLAYVAMVGGGS